MEKTVTKLELNHLIELGFTKRKGSHHYFYKDISAKHFGDYFFFRYCGKDLPTSSNLESLKKLIEGIYN